MDWRICSRVNAMALDLLLAALDEEDGGENEETAGNGCEPDVPEEVAEKGKERHQTQTEPPRQAAKLFSEFHDMLRKGLQLYDGTARPIRL